MAEGKIWEMAGAPGRPRKFETPLELWERAKEYFSWCDSHPWYKNEAVKGGDMVGEIIKVPTVRPYTLKGLCIFIGVNEDYFYQFKAGEDETSLEFSRIITCVRDIIYTQKFEGAAVGAFNANIIARDLGLKENQSIDHQGSTGTIVIENKIISSGPELADDEGKVDAERHV